MRVWADLYDTLGAKTGSGPINAIKSASVTEELDGAGRFSLDLALDERVITTLAVDTEVRVMVQDEDAVEATEWVRGLIREHSVDDAESGTRITVSGPDTIDTLTEITVGIGRSYQNQTMQTILNSLIGMVSGWSVSVESAVASDLQSARFDGAHIQKAITRLVEENGIHFRKGVAANTLEVGAFGSLATTSSGAMVRAIKPPGEIGAELRANDAVLLVDRISRKSNSNDIVNWCIPIGAGAGSAALTLKYTTYAIYNENGTVWRAGTTSRYKIYRRVNANNIAEFYIDARDTTAVRMRQASVTFKEIGAVANSDSARRLAANMLAQAAMSYLDRQKVALVTYKLSAKNVKTNIRPGDKIQVQYAGRIEIEDETRSTRPRLTYIEVNEPMWVMKVSKKISDGAIDFDYEVATIDRYEMDTSRIIVSMMEAVQAQNFSVQTFPAPYNYIYTDTVGWNGSNKPGRFYLDFEDEVIDLIKVMASFKTFPLEATTIAVNLSPFQYNWALRESYNYPSDVSFWINSVDVSSVYGGPWNVGGTNAALDIPDLDITTYIENASGGFRQTHLLELRCETRLGEVRYDTSFPSVIQAAASAGKAQMALRVLTNARATAETN